ncbi:MAG: hypothetical protein CM15mP29_3750 [Alphaproteobacteria bacterium]|nr:MAG: hypothetical protein CM15mP29_3750 [Alphaproteobacteria bacterium]
MDVPNDGKIRIWWACFPKMKAFFDYSFLAEGLFTSLVNLKINNNLGIVI